MRAVRSRVPAARVRACPSRSGAHAARRGIAMSFRAIAHGPACQTFTLVGAYPKLCANIDDAFPAGIDAASGSRLAEEFLMKRPPVQAFQPVKNPLTECKYALPYFK
eukprot:10439071-Alexandrium_andersonii.AAC.1